MLLTGGTYNGYQIGEALGQGQQASIYKASRTGREYEAVIKVYTWVCQLFSSTKSGNSKIKTVGFFAPILGFILSSPKHRLIPWIRAFLINF